MRHRCLRRLVPRAARARRVPAASQFEAWFPSLAHTDADIERTVEAAAEAFAEIGRPMRTARDGAARAARGADAAGRHRGAGARRSRRPRTGRQPLDRPGPAQLAAAGPAGPRPTSASTSCCSR